MKKHLVKMTTLGLLLITVWSGCKPEYTDPVSTATVSPSTLAVISAGFPETFESGSKTAYAAGDVSLASGTWYFEEALIGSLANDRKNGSKSVRIRDLGRIQMKFDLPLGIADVNIKHAVYGSDGGSSWELWKSTDGGSNWSQVGSAVNSSSTTLQTANFTVNDSGLIRFEIRKTSGSGRRINIDDIVFTDLDSTGGDTACRNVHIALGNPSSATTSTNDSLNYLMEKTTYTLSYNKNKGTANWTSWHLNPCWKGGAARQDDYRSDGTLPAAWYHVDDNDFSGSGFDRGHLCPSEDRDFSIAENSSTFLMTNMIPQAPNNNRITWVALENYCRELVDDGNELYIIAGVYGSGGSGSNGGTTTTLVGGLVTVPEYVWKIIVVIPQGSNDLGRINSSTRVIAVKMPNTQSVNGQPWGYYRISIDDLETLTGFDFLSNLGTTLQGTLESAVDSGPTS